MSVIKVSWPAKKPRRIDAHCEAWADAGIHDNRVCSVDSVCLCLMDATAAESFNSGTLNLQGLSVNISHSTVMDQGPIMCHTSRCFSKIIRAGKKRCHKKAHFEVCYQSAAWSCHPGLTLILWLTGNSYNVYQQDIPKIDMYTHLPRWINYIEGLLGRHLEPDESIFPYFRPNGIPDMSREMTHEMVQSLINTFTSEAGLLKYFTTHCFWRGGAQYRFMYAPIGQRWSLCKIH